MSREGLDRLIEQVRQVAYRLHGHIRLNLVWFMRRLNLLPILPISTAKHTREMRGKGYCRVDRENREGEMRLAV